MILNKFRTIGWTNNSSILTHEQCGCWGFYIRLSASESSTDVVTCGGGIIVRDRRVTITYDKRHEDETWKD